ncbi:PadR family transcriptional regulator [Gulosibacter macacae]|uniref:PadR family transcriptional regulator n=1 Tax=Gulosibacter macacae TaxID=2488791 RepID=A0A3P3W082_9MICO|nr:PadR family transcriptional regulator [Gulosibacter macacae]RRJ87877.1 PadR family transcriptional regulator [Gulosibacter macacae]
MANPQLSTAGQVILGLLALEGPKTSYELHELIDQSVGNFWNFPRSQVYAAPRKLAELGLVDEEQEEDGRRRRHFTITDAGREALMSWLNSPGGRPELRDGGLLRLFFADLNDDAEVKRLADEQVELHKARLNDYEHLVKIGRTEAFDGATIALRAGLHYERSQVAFWGEVSDAYTNGKSKRGARKDAVSAR